VELEREGVCECRERGGARWEVSLRDDIIGECNQFGGVIHIFVDRESEQGNVYVKCPSVAAAVSSVNTLHGRFYAGPYYSTLCRCSASSLFVVFLCLRCWM